MSFPAYDEYKETDDSFLGDVPEHWLVTKLGFLCRKVGSGKTPKGGSETYVDDGVLFIRSQNVYDEGLRLDDVVYISEEVDEEMAISRVERGDVLLNITGASLGRTCLVADDIPSANVNQHVCIIRLKEANQREFVAMAMKAFLIKSQIDACQNGAAREGLNFEQIGQLRLAIPPVDEQEAISSFLDVETSKIDGLVSEQRLLIELLKEKRQAVISHAVTKGLPAAEARQASLCPGAPMKPSGIQWLGDVPLHWSVLPVKRGITKIGQGFSPQCHSEPASDEEWGVVKVGCCNKFDLNEGEQKRLPLEMEPVLDYEIQDGDILMSRGNTLDLVGMAALVRDVRPRLLLCDLVYRFRAIPDEFDPAFLVYSLRSKNVRSQIECNAVGSSSTMKKVSQELVRNLLVCRPPLKEQQEISNRVATMSDEFDSLEEEAERAIELLHERRTALTSAAVTGKIDVRESAYQETA